MATSYFATQYSYHGVFCNKPNTNSKVYLVTYMGGYKWHYTVFFEGNSEFWPVDWIQSGPMINFTCFVFTLMM